PPEPLLVAARPAPQPRVREDTVSALVADPVHEPPDLRAPAQVGRRLPQDVADHRLSEPSSLPVRPFSQAALASAAPRSVTLPGDVQRRVRSVRSVFIPNRGEIAVRIVGACRTVDLECVV